jgi:hypothetical protein
MTEQRLVQRNLKIDPSPGLDGFFQNGVIQKSLSAFSALGRIESLDRSVVHH